MLAMDVNDNAGCLSDRIRNQVISAVRAIPTAHHSLTLMNSFAQRMYSSGWV